MGWVTHDFLNILNGRRYVGGWKPTTVVEIQRGNFRRDYRTWAYDDVHATIPGEDAGFPWWPKFEETTGWARLPNISSVDLTTDFDQNGCQVATVVMDNVEYLAQTGATALAFHTVARGYFAAYRGFKPDTRPDSGLSENIWARVVDEMANIRIWVGFGEPEVDGDGIVVTSGGAKGCWVFNGLVDDVDLDAQPAQITLTARMGKTLTDARLFGWNKSKQLKDPVTFVGSTVTDGADLEATMPRGTQAIRVDDVSDMVKVVLRWAGFTEWEVENTGVSIKTRKPFNRSTFLIDVIKAACDQTGFVFFIADPTNGNSIGVPTFRRASATLKASIGLVAELRQDDFITDLAVKLSEEPRGYIIRVRGKESKVGSALGGDLTTRIMAVYRPPWTQDNSMAGIIKHVTHTDFNLGSFEECLAGCYLIAIAEALEAVTATAQINGNPNIELDDQVGILETTTGVNSRMWVRSRTLNMSQGERAAWTMTLTGSLIDVPDMQDLLDEIDDITWGSTLPPAKVSGRRDKRIRE